MIGTLKALARRRRALVTLSDAQRTLLALDARAMRERSWAWSLGSGRLPRVSVSAGIVTLGLLVMVITRPRRVLKLASAALAIYPIARRLFGILRAR